MSDQFRYSYFSIALANGWDATIRDTEDYPSVAIVPFADDAVLSLSTKTLEQSGGLDGQQWVQNVADVNRKNRRILLPAVRGDFHGYVVPWKIRSLWGRSWALHCRGSIIEAMYHCPDTLRGRDERVVSSMLASLRYEPEACDS
jgi:hypothetical protein